MRYLLLLLTLLPLANAQNRNLEIYWVDVEGGASTLLITPAGESMLIDTGWATGGRDARRIFDTAQHAGLKSIDYLVMSHFHADHAGGLPALAKMIPIQHFYDRGDAIEKENQQWLDGYLAAAQTAGAGKRTIVKAGDKIPVKGLDVLVVSSNQQMLAQPAKGGGPNRLCADAEQKEPAGPENGRGVGLLVGFGRFKYLNLIDLDWSKEMELACPVNKLGKVTLYQTGRHGSFDGAGAPALLGAITPQVVVVNNGPRKGLGQVDNTVRSAMSSGKTAAPYEKNAYLRLAGLPGIEGIWQGHLSLLDKAPEHNTLPDMIANLEESDDCKGNWIHASVGKDGKFTITNGRNGFSKSYAAR
jgi:competence protein ComEC